MKKQIVSDEPLPSDISQYFDSEILPVLFDQLHINYSVIDRNGDYLIQNRSLIKAFSQGKTKAQEIDPVSWADCVAVLESGEKKVIEEYFEDKYFLSVKLPIKKNEAGDYQAIIIVSIDITDRKIAQNEAAHAIIKAKAETELRQAVMIFSGSIAHDLRTPLADLDMNTTLLMQHFPHLVDGFKAAKEAGLVNPPANTRPKVLGECLESINQAISRMRGDIRDSLRTLKQLVLGEIKKEDLVVCDIGKTLHGINNRPPFQEGQRDKIHISFLHPFSFLGNDALLTRVIYNLINNSFQQIEKVGRGEIFISTEVSAEHNLVRVKDTAGGASPEIVSTIFEGYRTTKSEGTGVGLGFCRLTMESFGGNITCHSVEGDYIEFVLSFPKLSLANP